MKTHYGVLWFNLIISFMMACSLNIYTESDLYLPVFFLYFASNLATFLDKYVTYRDEKLICEQYLSFICILLSAGMVLLYLFHTLGYLEIRFEPVCEEYQMQIRSVSKSFYTFNSDNITNRVFAIAFWIPVTYALLLLLAYLREEGYTLEIFKAIVTKKWKAVIGCILAAGALGGAAVGYCFYKYKKECEGYGSPQWAKYLVCVFIVTFVVELFFLMKCNKDILERGEAEEKKDGNDDKLEDKGA